MSEPSSRDIQLGKLKSQVEQLHENLSNFNVLITETCGQYKSIETLGKLHAGLFMASHAVFENENFEEAP